MIIPEARKMEEKELIDERYDLVMERIRQIPEEGDKSNPLLSYFSTCAGFLDRLSVILERSLSGGISAVSTKDLADENRVLYEDVLPEKYGVSFADPDHAVSVFEDAGIPESGETGRYLSFLYTEIRGLIGYAFEGKKEIFTIHAELFDQIRTAFRLADEEDKGFPSAASIRDIIYWFESDNCDIIIPDSVADKIDPARDLLRRIICDEDLSDERFLYLSGEYVTEEEIKIARYMSQLPEETIRIMADTFTEGYRTGFVKAGKPLDRKKSVNIRYSLGFERMIRKAIENFEKMGLESIIYRAGSLALTRSQSSKIGFYGAVPNRQYDYDHKDDAAIFTDPAFVTRRLEVLESAYQAQNELANTHAGPAVVETFGEEPFTPAIKEGAIKHTEKTQKLSVSYSAKASEIINRYIIGEERSFTIIAFPVPQIGRDFKSIFEDTIKLNTLSYEKYEKIQQCIIDELDKADSVEIKGRGANRTDITVSLHPIGDPSKQTKFENCVADVNIPVGEVFTSPQLKGTNGVLNVTKVFLNGLLYKDLTMDFSNGMISSYSCANYEDEEEGRRFIRDNILHKHDSLPIGEFAIGTNTTAYRMGRDYNIEGKLPILIAEKTGPHFAVGDTCYSHEEDVKVYNPDGKEIIARENEVSAKRNEDPEKAYFQCHTDITIPYDELAYIRTSRDGEKTYIIKDGRFTLPGCEELNGPLD